MGALHKGHSELIKAAHNFDEAKPISVLTSVFVNPLQFAPGEDFKKYPRNFQKDCKVAQESGSSAIWSPSIQDIFPENEKSLSKTNARDNLASSLCGLSRPGHFEGVVNVVERLLTLVKPEVLVLGEKDWQQLLIIRELIKDLKLPLKVRGVKTFREKDGLAFSSRNSYLTAKERQKALAIPRLLAQAEKEFKSSKKIKLQEWRKRLNQEGLEVEYLELVDPWTLQTAQKSHTISLLAAAVKCGKTRLIDHKFLMERKPIVAIDGPAGAGKSTVTKIFAKKVGLLYLDTGAMYRAVTWFIQQKGIDPKNKNEVKDAIQMLQLELNLNQSGSQSILVDGKDVSEDIRSQSISNIVSEIAKQEAVRKVLTTHQKSLGINGGLVAEGRDIGSTVFPDAELKIFLTATTKERARRRYEDLKNRGYTHDSIEEIETQIRQRDEIDRTREISPLIKSHDAIELVTDGMNIEKVVDSIADLFKEKVPQEVWPSN